MRCCTSVEHPTYLPVQSSTQVPAQRPSPSHKSWTRKSMYRPSITSSNRVPSCCSGLAKYPRRAENQSAKGRWRKTVRRPLFLRSVLVLDSAHELFIFRSLKKLSSTRVFPQHMQARATRSFSSKPRTHPPVSFFGFLGSLAPHLLHEPAGVIFGGNIS